MLPALFSLSVPVLRKCLQESGEGQAKVSVSFPESFAGAGKQPGTVLALGET